MALDFPTTGLTPNVTTYTLGSRTWLWNGTAWQLSYNPSGYTGSVGATGYVGSKGDVGYTGSAGAYLPFGTSGDATDIRLIALALSVTT